MPEDEDDLVPINVWLAGRSYRIRVHAQEEADVHQAVKRADEKIAELRRHYAGKDDQDFVAMCLLMYAADAVTDPTHQTGISGQLQQMIGKIDEALG
jgi:cell division protein ZapA